MAITRQAVVQSSDCRASFVHHSLPNNRVDLIPYEYSVSSAAGGAVFLGWRIDTYTFSGTESTIGIDVAAHARLALGFPTNHRNDWER